MAQRTMRDAPARVAVIGGTGMNRWPALEIVAERAVQTPFGEPSGPLVHGRVEGTDALFLARHGPGHRLAPHAINYRANLWALKEAGVRRIVAVAAVGGIGRSLPPSAVALPHDLVDYTWGRAHTFHDGVDADLQHVDLTQPYSAPVRRILQRGARSARVRLVARGVMGVTQGPRLETPAEIRRLRRDGCTMVGMTGMPEAALAREVGIEYAALAVSVNWAAGLGRGDIHGEIGKFIEAGMKKVRAILAAALPALARV